MPKVLDRPPLSAPPTATPRAAPAVPRAAAGRPAWEPRAIPAGQVFRVSWVTYEQYVAVDDALPPKNCHATYVDGELQLMSHGPVHEEFKKVLTLLVYALGRAFGRRLKPMGNVTLRRPGAGPGFEPDECFYTDADRGAFAGLTPEQMPAPALALEVEVASTVLGRLPAYSAVGVPEVWRCDGAGGVAICLLAAGPGSDYDEATESRLFPGLTGALIWEAATTLPDDEPVEYQLAAAAFFRARLSLA